MIAVNELGRHDDVWLLLPWLANGQLTGGDKLMAEEHVRHCDECKRELSAQKKICLAFDAPDRVIYAPGPSLRKLMDRIDADEAAESQASGKSGKPREAAKPDRSDRLDKVQPYRQRTARRGWTGRLGAVSLWRPPGLAWAASFLLLFGFTAMTVTTYRWSEPRFQTRSDPKAVAPDVLHIALDRSLTIGAVEELLQSGGARIVEGPDTTGILGVTPVGVVTGKTPAASVDRQLRELSARLRKDPRVLWVQPLADDAQEH